MVTRSHFPSPSKSPAAHRAPGIQPPPDPSHCTRLGNVVPFEGWTATLATSTPGLQTIVLTVQDSTSMGPRGGRLDFFDPAFLDGPAKDAIKKEYLDFALALYETQRGSGKRFVIGNWETDNHLTCGAGEYATNAAHRARCDAEPVPPWQRVQGFIRWFNLRKAAIREARTIAAQRGWTGVEVNDAIEVATLRLLHNHGYPSAIYDVVPQVQPEVVTYSAWETTGRGRIDEDLADMRSLAAPAELMLGEFGYVAMSDPRRNDIAWRMLEAVQAAKRAQIGTAVLWAAFPNVGLSDGLLNVDGSESRLAKRLREEFVADPTPSPNGPRIHGAIEYVSSAGTPTSHYAELYGTYPAGSYTASVICDDRTVNAQVFAVKPGQINVGVQFKAPDADPGATEMWCSFRVSNGVSQSNRFGPRKFCKDKRCTVDWPGDPTTPQTPPRP